MFGVQRLRGFGILVFFFLSAASQATLVAPRTLEQLAATASVVLWGRVDRLEIDSQTGVRKAVIRRTEAYSPAESARFAEAGEKEFFVRLENRAIPGSALIERVAGAPDLRADEEVLIFLSPALRSSPINSSTQATLWIPTGFHQGIYRIMKDKEGLRRALSFREWATAPVSDQDLQKGREAATKKVPKSSSLPKPNNASALSVAPQQAQIHKACLLSDLLDRIREAQFRASKQEDK